MVTDIKWIKISVLVLISIFKLVSVSSSLSRSAGKHNWTDSFRTCNLAKENHLDEIKENERVWVGGVFKTTPWMTHEDLEVLGESDGRKACTILQRNRDNRVFFHAANCSDKYKLFCHLSGTDYKYDTEMTYEDAIKNDNECKLLRDWDREYYGLVPHGRFVWTAVHRYTVLIWPLQKDIDTDEMKMENPNATCLAYEGKTNKRIQLPCSTPLQYMCITESPDHTRITTLTTFNNFSSTTMTSFGNYTVELKQGQILQYIIPTSIVSGLVIITICAVWMCKKGKETIKRESNISFQRNTVTLNAVAAVGHISAHYAEVNYNDMIDFDMKHSQKKGVIVGAEPTCPSTQRSQSYGNLFPQLATISQQHTKDSDINICNSTSQWDKNEYERPYHTLQDNRLSSKHEYC